MIVEIIDQNRAVIDGPTTAVPRHVCTFHRMTLTKLVVKGLPRGCGSVAVARAVEKSGVVAQWSESPTAKQAAKKAVRAALTDFERFKVMALQKKRSHIVKA